MSNGQPMPKNEPRAATNNNFIGKQQQDKCEDV